MEVASYARASAQVLMRVLDFSIIQMIDRCSFQALARANENSNTNIKGKDIVQLGFLDLKEAI